MKVRLTKGFKLIECDARIVIIAILTALVSLTLVKYTQDADEKMPSTSFLSYAAGWAGEIYPYVKSTDLPGSADDASQAAGRSKVSSAIKPALTGKNLREILS